MTTSDVLPCACTTLRKAARAASRFYDEALAQTGLTTTQFAILRHVERLGEPPLSRLAESLVMDRTSLYRSLQPMVREGWLEVEPVSARSKRARLTPEGRAKMAGATEAWEAAQAAFVSRFGQADWSAISAGLQRVPGLL